MKIILAITVGIVMMSLLIAFVPFNRDTNLTYWITAISYSTIVIILTWDKEKD